MARKNSKNKILFLALALILLFVSFLINVWHQADAKINEIVTLVHASPFVVISKFIGVIFDPPVIMTITLIIVAILWLKLERVKALQMTLIMAINAAIFFSVKYIVQRTRPLNMLVIETQPSFPSGHATTAIVFFGLLTWFILPKLKQRSHKIALVFTSVIATLVVGLSRIYLNVHWMSDVLGGFCLGAFVLCISFLLMRK